MRKIRLRSVGLLVSVAIVAGAATAFGDLSSDFSSPAAPVPGGTGTEIYLQMTGAQTGTFTGGVTAAGFKGAIQVLALDTSATSPQTNPCAPIEFRKATDQTTPRLFAAEASSDTINRAVFTELRTVKGTPQPELRISTTDAAITAVHHVDSTTTGAYDDVTLTPRNVSVEWLPSKSSFRESCAPSP